MIKLPAVERGERAIFDNRGRRARGTLPEAPAVLVAKRVTDAVKSADRGFITGGLDRDELWAVEGFALSGEVVEALGADEIDPADLVERVGELGYDWLVFEVD